jgi:light-regulated signal transduction histidine kinase (bacteriophytochrome)
MDDGPHAHDARAVDLSNCEREPIHTPGGVQAHARLIALNPATGTPLALSANWADNLDDPLAALAPESRDQLRAFGAGGAAPESLVFADGQGFEAHGFRADDALILELEPEGTARAALEAMRRGDGAMRAMRSATGEAALFRQISDAIQGVTGFDRVMVYRFDDEWNGEVVAETASANAPARFIGLRFPATDIPAQARALFLRNRVRQIVDVDAAPVPLVPDRHPASGAPLDLSDARARAVSPIHLEYLRNMGVRASLTIALIVRDTLWGLIACHHYGGPHYVSPALRATCALLCEAFSARLTAWLGAERAARLESADERLLAKLPLATAAAADTSGEGFEAFVADHAAEILEIANADAGLFTVGARRVAIGPTPLETLLAADMLVEAGRARGTRFATDDLRPLGAARPPEIAGACVVELTGERGRLTLFRRETPREESWAGDPDKLAIPGEGDRLHPRK